ncbi:MAG: hypothetical protein QXN55_01150 [Candidatus Nitrosotenuis sp.]
MKLHRLSNAILAEKKAEIMIDDSSPLERPIGISRDEWTPEYQDRLRKIRKNNPYRYEKMVRGD